MFQFANLSDLAIKKQLRERLAKPVELDGDPYFDDIAKVGALLSSEKLCIAYARRLNDALVHHAKQQGVFDTMTKDPWFGERRALAKPPGHGPHKAKVTLDSGTPGALAMTVERHKHHKVLSGFLTEYEAGRGFNEGAYEFISKNKPGQDVTLSTQPGKAVTLPGFVPPRVFRDELLAKARHFKDPDVGALHGEFTHRIQWYIVCEHALLARAFQHGPADLFKACARDVFRGNNTSVWDVVFEGGAGNTQDFRKPEALTEFFLRVSRQGHALHHELWFLAGLMEGRYAKRTLEKNAS